MKKLYFGFKAFIFLMVWALAGYSQTGPAGVGNSAINVLWLRADNGAYNDAGTTLASNGQNVRQWNDQSGNAKNASEGGVGQQPVYTTNIVNSFPVLRFDGSNDRLLSTAISTGNSASIWVVASYSSLPSSNPGLVQGSRSGQSFSTTANEKSIGMWVENTNKPWGRGVDNNSPTYTQRNISKVTSTSSGVFYMINSIYKASTTTINQYINNAISGTSPYSGTLRSWTDFGIGRQGSESWSGDIAEVIVFNSAVNETERIMIDNYLSAKYNIALAVPANDIYSMDDAANGNFDYEMAGIGQASDGSNLTSAQGTGVIKISNPRGLANNEYLTWGSDNGTLGQSFSDLPVGIQVKLGRTWRASETGEVGNVDLVIDLSSLGAVTTTDLRLIIDTDNDGVLSDETPISGASSLGGGLYQFGNFDLDNGQRFTIGSINKTTTPLPIELVSFTAEKDETSIRLKWTTATEINNDFFTIERSSNGVTYEFIGRVDGAGNSSSQKKYSLVDEKPLEGNSYYRLKQNDYDGKSETFPAIAVYYELKSNGECILKVFPNPCLGQCSVSLEGCDNTENPDIAVEVLDAAGNKVYSKVPYPDDKGLFNFQIDTENNLKPGIYIVRGANKKSSYAQKLIVK